MAGTNASVLFVSNAKSQIISLGVDQISINSFLQNENQREYGITIVDNLEDSPTNLKKISEKINSTQKFPNVIYLFKKTKAQDLEFVNSIYTHSVINEKDIAKQLESEVKDLLLSLREKIQNRESEKLLEEQSLKLAQLQLSLKNNLSKIDSNLPKTLARQKKTNERLETLHKLLLNLHHAQSISELESIIQKEIQGIISTEAVKISFQQQTSLPEQNPPKNIYICELDHGFYKMGYILYIKKSGVEFLAEEKKFIHELNEAISLSINRLIIFEKKLSLKEQWETAFKAFRDVIAVIDSDYNIIQSNKVQNHKVKSNKCYKLLFGANSPCEGCALGKDFNLKQKNEVFAVNSQALHFNRHQSYIHVYRNITQQLGLERQLVESAKMAELGTIGSSIAHEINNPLGGMINFLQLIKMDISSDKPYYADIIEMEKAAIRCKNIVKNLLGFSRESEPDTEKNINIIKCIEQAIQIIELKTRSVGIKITSKLPQKDFLVAGRHNYLTQSIKNILQNAQESIAEKRLRDKNFRGEIKITFSIIDKDALIEISDDGLGIEADHLDKVFAPLFTTKDDQNHSGLGLTLAQKIIHEHKGSISINTEKNLGTRVAIRIPQAFGET